MGRSADELLELVLRGGHDAAQAFDDLTQLAERAVPTLIAALPMGRGHALMTAALGALDLADAIGTLSPLAHHPDRAVRHAAVTALGRSGDSRAAAVLGDVLAGGDHLLATLEALGNLGASDGRAIVRSAVDRRVGDVTHSSALAEVCAR